MPQGVEVQVLSSALERRTMPRRLMVGQQPLELFTVVRIHAGQQNLFKTNILDIFPCLGGRGKSKFLYLWEKKREKRWFRHGKLIRNYH